MNLEEICFRIVVGCTYLSLILSIIKTNCNLSLQIKNICFVICTACLCITIVCSIILFLCLGGII